MERLIENMRAVLRRPSFLILVILVFALFLRIWQLDKVPVSLFGDELDVGYQAYSILKTGKDYSGNFIPMHFRSLAEWRTPLYIYSAVPTVGLFGISPLGVRLPAAIFGILSVWMIYLLVKKITNNKTIGLLSALFLAISPWHLQYSRAGFEVTEMLFFYIAGIYFLLKGLKIAKWLIVAVICLGITPWIYSTAKLFMPLTMIAILLIWWKEIKITPRKYLLGSIVTFILIVGPFAFNTLFGGGAQRIEGISIFNDATIVPKIGFERLNDIKMRDKNATNTSQATFIDKVFHNQFLAFSSIFFKNYFQAFSPEFLFIQGDTNPRHSSGIGEFYKVQAPFLLLGFAFLLTRLIDRKAKIFLIFWLLCGPIPSSLTRDGGIHATRLILLLPPLIILISLGVYYAFQYFKKYLKWVFLVSFTTLLFVNFLLYEHNFWVHYPWDSKKWWHAGFKEAIQSAVSESNNYEKVIISQADEPALIFFLGYSLYPPDQFQKKYPLMKENVQGFGPLSKLDKFSFPSIGQGIDLYKLGSVLPPNTLYLATIKEINLDLIRQPERVPKDIKLIKSITYPSGDPAFYLFQRAM